MILTIFQGKKGGRKGRKGKRGVRGDIDAIMEEMREDRKSNTNQSDAMRYAMARGAEMWEMTYQMLLTVCFLLLIPSRRSTRTAGSSRTKECPTTILSLPRPPRVSTTSILNRRIRFLSRIVFQLEWNTLQIFNVIPVEKMP